MIQSLIRERGEQEADLARQWWQFPPDTLLTLADGSGCQVLYTGQSGGAAGPDVRDAVLRFLPRDSGTTAAFWDEEMPLKLTGKQVAGDVEFHLRTSDWFIHGHHNDPRYNQVILHVALILDSSTPTRRQDGYLVPTCSLHDWLRVPESKQVWPCQQMPLTGIAMISTLLHAGLLRLLEKSQLLQQSLAETWPPAGSPFNRYDTCLLPALAEGLGYGRDRDFFRAAGQRLVGISVNVPEPLGHTGAPAPLDARRLGILRTLTTRWGQSGIWQTLRPALNADLDVKGVQSALRAIFHPLNQTRTDIIICNVVLPFAIAVAQEENCPQLATRAQQIYLAYPGLESNRVTRFMSTQLQLTNEPEQACLQQGLQHIYSQNCQAKICQNCLCGEKRL